MPPLTNASILAQFRAVLANWNYTDYVTAKPLALDWIANNLGGLSLKDIAKAMNDHCRTGGVIDQVRERRPEHSAWPYHYDFRMQLAGKDVYIETILQDDDPNDPTICIVSIHDV
jgi:hypothetical protein